jgi:hypothetical protein
MPFQSIGAPRTQSGRGGCFRGPPDRPLRPTDASDADLEALANEIDYPVDIVHALRAIAADFSNGPPRHNPARRAISAIMKRLREYQMRLVH